MAPPTGRERRPPAPLTAESIRAAAQDYVARREGSAAMVRAALARRLRRRLAALPPEQAEAERDAALPLIEAEVARLEQAGLVADARFAGLRARAALEGGRGARRILRDLGAKGVEAATARAALEEAAREIAPEGDDPLREAEAEAAETFARRRRIGPFRATPAPQDRAGRARLWSREAAAMARAGFGPDLIRATLGREPEAEG
jgi:regulatory protein